MSARRSKAMIAVICSIAAFGSAVASASADPYTFRDLRTCCDLAGTSTPYQAAEIAAAVNDDGDVVGTAAGTTGGASNEAYILKNGQFTVLQYLATLQYQYGSADGGNPFSFADDLNDSDVVVGYSSDGFGTGSLNHTGGEHPVVWRPFAATNPSDAAFDLGQLEASTLNACDQTLPTDCYGVATNVNADGNVVGYGEYADYPNAENDFFTVPWTVPGGSRQLAQVPATVPGPEAVSTDMVFFEHEAKPFGGFYTSGVNTDTSPALDQIVVWPDPNNISSNNGAVCTTTNGGAPKCTSVPFDTSWHDDDRHAINDVGWVVGTLDSTSAGGPGQAMVWENGTAVSLPPLTGDTGGDSAVAINDNGDIVGSSIDVNGCPNATLWPAGHYNAPIDLNAAESSRDEDLYVAQDISDTGDIVGQGGPACTATSDSYVSNADPWELIAPTPTTAKLTVTLAGTGHGTVTGTSAGAATGISCPGTCAQNFSVGATVKLTALPAAASTFSGFTGGGCTGTSTTCVVTMSKAQDVTAKFTGRPPKCTVSAISDGVLLKKLSGSKLKPGVLEISTRCTQAAAVRLTGTLVELLGAKSTRGKQRTIDYSLGPVRATVIAAKAKTLSVKLPSRALDALAAGHHESVTLTLGGTNVNGTSRARASVAALKLLS